MSLSDEATGPVKAKLAADGDPDIWKETAYALVVFWVYFIVTLGKKALWV